MADTGPIHSSEAFVTYLAQKSFLSLWCYANPKGKGGKELCDVLVVCDPHVIIISVKDCRITDSGDSAVDAERWTKRAVEASAKQIYGAERYIRDSEVVVTKDGEKALPFPDKSAIRVHRVAVAFGSEGRTWIAAGDFGRGFVHVFDEVSLQVVMRELDTITDLVEYLEHKESFLAENRAIVARGEENLLAHYLRNNRKFPDANLILPDDEDWETFTSRDNYLNGKRENRVSYAWDSLIEKLCELHKVGNLVGRVDPDDVENVLRYMVRERRLFRRSLTKALVGFLDPRREAKLRARATRSPSGVVYVFLACRPDESREYRRAELFGRCLVAKSKLRDAEAVVGIVSEGPEYATPASLDMLCLKIDEWNEDWEAQAQKARKEFGFFENPVQRTYHEVEYPLTKDPDVPGAFRSRKGKIGRNEHCPCGSGKKYKRCCGRGGRRSRAR